MLHTKFQGHPPIASGVEDFLRFLPYIGIVAMLVISQLIGINFHSHSPNTKFQGHRSIASGEEDFLRFLPYMGMAAMLVM